MCIKQKQKVVINLRYEDIVLNNSKQQQSLKLVEVIKNIQKNERN